MDYIKLVSELNAELYERFGETEVNFSYSTNGYVECILFSGGDIQRAFKILHCYT